MPITTSSSTIDEATNEQISTLFCIFLYKNKVSTLSPILDTCHTFKDLSSPQVTTFDPDRLITAPATEVWLAGNVYSSRNCYKEYIFIFLSYPPDRKWQSSLRSRIAVTAAEWLSNFWMTVQLDGFQIIMLLQPWSDPVAKYSLPFILRIAKVQILALCSLRTDLIFPSSDIIMSVPSFIPKAKLLLMGIPQRGEKLRSITSLLVSAILRFSAQSTLTACLEESISP